MPGRAWLALVAPVWVVVLASVAGGCASTTPRHAVRPAPIDQAWRTEPGLALCTAHVSGRGQVDVEQEYLPRVVSCENGGAGYEALKAQAIAARTYLRHTLERRRSIADGASAQVYSCGRPPRAEHYRAVQETAGQVLRYHGTTIAAFYVAGARQMPPSCVDPGRDQTDTERYVTYNGTRAGGEVRQSRLGRIARDNHANRGAMSQNGSGCLAALGWSHADVLRFYYGRDIEIAQTRGPCVPEPALPPNVLPEPVPEPVPAPAPIAPPSPTPEPGSNAAWASASGSVPAPAALDMEQTPIRLEDFDPSHEVVDPVYP